MFASVVVGLFTAVTGVLIPVFINVGSSKKCLPRNSICHLTTVYDRWIRCRSATGAKFDPGVRAFVDGLLYCYF